jgi:cobalt-precorrin 5A hydrolase
MAGEEAVIVAGVGFRRGTSADEIERLVRLALNRLDLPVERLTAIATEADKAVERGPPEAARRLAVPLIACATTDLAGVADCVLTASTHALEAKGVPSIAEASALVAAGRNARLLGERIISERVACAVAIGDGR